MQRQDAEILKQAAQLARSGDPSPAPRLAALVVSGTKTLGEAAMVNAASKAPIATVLEELGPKALGKTLYVTLEPGAYGDDGGDLVERILSAGIKRVVIGSRDLREREPGTSSVERLLAAKVVVDVLELPASSPARADETAAPPKTASKSEVRSDDEEAIESARRELAQLIAPWRRFATTGSAYVSLKLALSLDGRIATRTGASKWITCPESRIRVHALRAQHDAVMVGINTVIADDPMLTVRAVSGRNPARVVIDSKLRIPLESRMVKTASEVPTCVITTAEASHDAARELEDRRIAIVRVPATTDGRCDMRAALRELAAREVVSVLCEGGAELAGSLLAQALASEMHAFVAPLLLGPRGRAGAVDWAGPENPSDAPRIEHPTWELCGRDAYVHGPMLYSKRAL